jgi:hypothetical protein
VQGIVRCVSWVGSVFAEVVGKQCRVVDAYGAVVVQVCVAILARVGWLGAERVDQDYGVAYVNFSVEVEDSQRSWHDLIVSVLRVVQDSPRAVKHLINAFFMITMSWKNTCTNCFTLFGLK